MSHPGQQPHPYTSFNSAQQPVEQKPRRSAGKRVGVALGGVAALVVSFFAGGVLGVEIGYDNAKADVAAAFTDTFGGESAEPAANGSAGGAAGQAPQSVYPVTLNVGGFVEVPCSMYSLDEGMCMTLTLTEVNPQAVCPESNHPGRFVSLSFDASMPTNADPDFTSPFGSFPWSAITADGRKTSIMPESYCNGGATHGDLRDEFPGYSASGTAYLPVPDNVVEVHFESDHEHLFSAPIG